MERRAALLIALFTAGCGAVEPVAAPAPIATVSEPLSRPLLASGSSAPPSDTPLSRAAAPVASSATASQASSELPPAACRGAALRWGDVVKGEACILDRATRAASTAGLRLVLTVPPGPHRAGARLPIAARLENTSPAPVEVEIQVTPVLGWWVDLDVTLEEPFAIGSPFDASRRCGILGVDTGPLPPHALRVVLETSGALELPLQGVALERAPDDARCEPRLLPAGRHRLSATLRLGGGAVLRASAEVTSTR